MTKADNLSLVVAVSLSIPAKFMLGYAPINISGAKDNRSKAEIITVTPESEIVPLAKMSDLTLIENRWERIEIEGQFGRYNWEQTQIEIESQCALPLMTMAWQVLNSPRPIPAPSSSVPKLAMTANVCIAVGVRSG